MSTKYPLLLLCLLTTLGAQAREVDNYMAWGVDIRDSGAQIDDYMRMQLKQALQQVNDDKFTGIPTGKMPHDRKQVLSEGYDSCYSVTHDMIRHAFYSPTYQKIEKYLENYTVIEIYPRRPSTKDQSLRVERGETPANGYMTNKEYRKTSIVETSPMNTPLSRIVNVYGIYTGADKFGHFTSFGVRYLRNFHEFLDDGISPEVAFQKVMDIGYQSENGVVGMYFTRVFSRGDLEANFQGMMFAWSLCQDSSEVRLRYDGEQWQLENLSKFTVQAYVNPNWDESFNTSLYSDRKWREQVVPTFIERKDCDKLRSAWVRKQREFYLRIERENRNTLHAISWVPENFEHHSGESHSLDVFCGQEPAGT